MVAADPDRFIKIAMGNTGLPYNPDAPQEVIDEVKEFRASNKKINFFQMFKEVGKMDNTKHMATKFMYWQKFTWDSKNLPIGFN